MTKARHSPIRHSASGDLTVPPQTYASQARRLRAMLPGDRVDSIPLGRVTTMMRTSIDRACAGQRLLPVAAAGRRPIERLLRRRRADQRSALGRAPHAAGRSRPGHVPDDDAPQAETRAKPPKSSCTSSARCRATAFPKSRSSSQRTAFASVTKRSPRFARQPRGTRRAKPDRAPHAPRTSDQRAARRSASQIDWLLRSKDGNAVRLRVDVESRGVNSQASASCLNPQLSTLDLLRNCPHAASIASPLRCRNRTAMPRPSRMPRNFCCAAALGVRYGSPATGLYGITFTSAVRPPKQIGQLRGVLRAVVDAAPAARTRTSAAGRKRRSSDRPRPGCRRATVFSLTGTIWRRSCVVRRVQRDGQPIARIRVGQPPHRLRQARPSKS